jgi:drug/metabolite transporter (DMT)-like permease
MAVVVLALSSAALYGAMTVALRIALVDSRVSAELGALCTVVPAFVVALGVALARGEWDVAGLWPFVGAGVLGPGLSQTLFTLGVREAGPARASVTVGVAPLFSVAIALVLLGEPVVAGVLAGAVLIVGGGVILVGERDRPLHVRRIGLVYALVSAFVFASRDNLVRWLATDSQVSPALAAAVTLGTGAIVIACWVLLARRPFSLAPIRAFAPAGVLFGLSYVVIFEAFFRGRVTVVSPLVATESLWGVGLSALFLRRVEVVGSRLALGAALIVGGGALIGIFR